MQNYHAIISNLTWFISYQYQSARSNDRKRLSHDTHGPARTRSACRGDRIATLAEMPEKADLAARLTSPAGQRAPHRTHRNSTCLSLMVSATKSPCPWSFWAAYKSRPSSTFSGLSSRSNFSLKRADVGHGGQTSALQYQIQDTRGKLRPETIKKRPAEVKPDHKTIRQPTDAKLDVLCCRSTSAQVRQSLSL